MRAEFWAACVAGVLLVGMGLSWLARPPVRTGRILTGLAALALGTTLALAMWDGGWSGHDLRLALLATSVAALGVFGALEPSSGGRHAGVLLAGSALGALALAELVLVSPDMAADPAERLWLYPAWWGASAVGYGAFAVASLGAVSEWVPGQREAGAGALVDRATVAGLLALGVGVLLGAAWSWLVWGTLWSGQAQMVWSVALAACGAAAVHAWRRGGIHAGVRTGLGLAGLLLIAAALIGGA